MSNGAIAAVMRSPATPEDRISGLLYAFRRWLYLPDPAPLTATLATVAANQLDGDPVWLLLVGPPASGKTEILDSLLGLPNMHPAGTLTEASLLSGVAKRERANDASGGLLRAIGPFGFLVNKDFTSVLSMDRETRTGLLGALREVYDGSWTRHVGADGGRTLHWEGKVALIGGVTPTLDQHHSVMAAMGERFLLCRMRESDPVKQAGYALTHVGTGAKMRKSLREAVREFFAHVEPMQLNLSAEEKHRLCALATLVSKCRSAVERDGYRREIELVPGSERPARLVIALAQFFHGLLTIGTSNDECWRVLRLVALDCIPAVRRDVFTLLVRTQGKWLSTKDVAEAVAYPSSTTRRVLEDLTAHGIVLRQGQGPGKSDIWTLSDPACKWYGAAGFTDDSGTGVPEMSEDANGTWTTVPEMSEQVRESAAQTSLY